MFRPTCLCEWGGRRTRRRSLWPGVASIVAGECTGRRQLRQVFSRRRPPRGARAARRRGPAEMVRGSPAELPVLSGTESRLVPGPSLVWSQSRSVLVRCHLAPVAERRSFR